MKIKNLILASCFFCMGCADMRMGQQAYDNGDYKTARANWQELADRGFPQAETKLGEMDMEGKDHPPDPDSAIQRYRQAIETEQYPHAMIDLGKAYDEGQGVPQNEAQARNLFEEASRLGDPHAPYQIGLLDLDQGKTEAAEQHFQDALHSGDIRAWAQLGLIQVKKGNNQLAENDFDQAIASGDVAANVQLGLLHERQGKLALAQQNYNVALNAGDMNAYIPLGSLFEQQGKLEYAEQAYKKALEEGNPYAHHYLGRLYITENKPKLAEAEFEQAAAAGDTGAYNKLASLYKDSGQWARAEDAFTHAIGNGYDKYFERGDVERLQGHYKQAMNDYKTALSHGNFRAESRIGEMYEKGEGVAPDQIYALSWFYKARKHGISDMDRKVAHIEKKLQPDGLVRAYQMSGG